MSGSSQNSLLSRLRQKTIHDWINVLDSLVPRLKSKFYYPLIFGSFGKGTILYRPVYLGNPRYIHIGSGTIIRPGARLQSVVVRPDSLPELRVGDNVNIEQNVQIICHHRVSIEKNVSITANCAIVDTTHPFDELPEGTKIGTVVLDDEGFVEIGEGTFLGIGCVVLPNVKIGRGSVIGSNSVVTRDVPARSVAAGAPARVTRKVLSGLG